MLPGVTVNQRNMLAITKRPAQFCGTQALLYASGIELVAADNMRSARKVIKDQAVKGVIVCMHSWSEQEREDIATELSASDSEFSVILRCPGCMGCDEAKNRAGALSDTRGLKKAIAAVSGSELHSGKNKGLNPGQVLG
jgi:hypothetical protein